MADTEKPVNKFLIPSPVPTKRTRTYSASERALQGPTYKGVIQSFCRQKGHGFIDPKDGTEKLFVHISDVDGDWVPKEGDEVLYKLCAVPPKMEKVSAVHVRITHQSEGSHEKWDDPSPKQDGPDQ